jgi:hypothetical protein
VLWEETLEVGLREKGCEKVKSSQMKRLCDNSNGEVYDVPTK